MHMSEGLPVFSSAPEGPPIVVTHKKRTVPPSYIPDILHEELVSGKQEVGFPIHAV